MFNPYVIILVLFALGGVAMTLRGWIVWQRSKKVKAWPKTKGEIISAEISATEFNEPLPKVMFSYRIGEADYNVDENFQDVSMSRERCTEIVEKYPADSAVDVYYDPNDPANATLDPSLKKDDWVVLVVGILVAVFGVLMLLLNVQVNVQEISGEHYATDEICCFSSVIDVCR